MKLLPAERKWIAAVLITISLFSWILLLFNPGRLLGIRQCHMSGMGTSSASLQMMLMMNPVSGLIIGWLLMVVAMMLPKLILPVHYIYSRSLKNRRFTSALLFLMGYITSWMAAGLFVITIELVYNLYLANSYLPILAIGVLTILWQMSPAKQYCLNKGHQHPALAAFSWEASRDALKFGINHGLWCVASGWALMLFPMLLSKGHELAMVFITFIMLSEHIEHPQTPRWRVNLSGKLTRYLIAQTRIRLQLKT